MRWKLLWQGGVVASYKYRMRCVYVLIHKSNQHLFFYHIYKLTAKDFCINQAEKMSSYLITGCSRGIGLALAGLLASKPTSEVNKIFAGARNETDSLKELIAESNGRVEFVPIEVTSEQSVKQAFETVKKALGSNGLDVLINNAGVMNYTKDGIENM